MPVGGREIGPKFQSVALFESREIERDSARQELHILAIAPRVSFQLRKRQVMALQSREAHPAVRAREDRDQSFCIVLGDSDDTHMLHVRTVLPVERRTPSGQRIQPSDFAGRDQRQEVDIYGWPR